MRQRAKSSDQRRKLVVISDCVKECPFIRTQRTPGSGYADDYLCIHPKIKIRKIVGYIEWDSELPPIGEFPDWCPLFEAEPGMYEQEETCEKDKG